MFIRELLIYYQKMIKCSLLGGLETRTWTEVLLVFSPTLPPTPHRPCFCPRYKPGVQFTEQRLSLSFPTWMRAQRITEKRISAYCRATLSLSSSPEALVTSLISTCLSTLHLKKLRSFPVSAGCKLNPVKLCSTVSSILYISVFVLLNIVEVFKRLNNGFSYFLEGTTQLISKILRLAKLFPAKNQRKVAMF